jgi:hypothetical protein
METTTHHSLTDLFDQLGLPSDPADIQRFVRQHHPLPAGSQLTEAVFWSEAQRSFLQEAWRADSGDWVMAVDELNALLHEHPNIEDLPDAQ